MNRLQPLIVTSARSQGQIAAGKVIPLTPRDKHKWIPLPKNARVSDKYDEYEVCGDSLEGLHIYDGMILTCRITFDITDVKPHKICIVQILPSNEQTAKMVHLNACDGTVTLIGANPSYRPQTFFTDEIEILAIVEEVRWKI